MGSSIRLCIQYRNHVLGFLVLNLRLILLETYTSTFDVHSSDVTVFRLMRRKKIVIL
jgi:hypothetical protein